MPMKKPWNIALGFYQNLKTAETVLNKLKKAGLKRSAYIHREHYGKTFVRHQGTAVTFLLLFGSLLLLFLLFLYRADLSPFLFYLLLNLGGCLFCLSIGTYYFYRLSPTLLNKYKKLVISDETLVIVQINMEEVPKALSILRHVESGHPSTFLLRSELGESNEKLELVKDPLTTEALADHARELAATLKDVNYKKSHKVPLLKNLRHCEKSLSEIRHVVGEAEFVEQTVTLAAEWLLDNTYVIQGSIEEVLRNLPKKYYSELPKISKGPWVNYPRVYLIAKDLIHYTANRLTRENMIAYLTSYQTVDQLTMGELWVLPLMLRLRLIECLNCLALDISRRLREGEDACFWGNRLLNISRREPERLKDFLADLEMEQKNPSSHFAEELIDHLYDEDKIIPVLRKWLENELHADLFEVIKEEQLQKTTEQIALSNAIVSLITLSQLSWREIFELVSPIDQILSQDPVNVYAQMDFNSRDNYRHQIEVLARRSNHKEGEIANLVLQRAQKGKDQATNHVGYYLIDRGRIDLEKSINYKPDWVHFIRRQMTLYPTSVYLGGIFLLTVIIECLLVAFLYDWHTPLGSSIILLALSLLPASEIAIQIVALVVTKILQPMRLPKLLFKEGIPESLKTFVVIPSLLIDADSVKENVNQLEIHFLANADKALLFGIFFDFVDAPQQHMPNDPELLNIAYTSFKDLEEKYGTGKFFLFYRERAWSNSQNAWIGHERKRGKLMALNRLFVGEACPEIIIKVGNKSNLNEVCYVITLDADTTLPKDAAKQLIEAISHPLNAPQIDAKGRIYRGYTIIQPRVGTDITRMQDTLFNQIFSDAQSINPYTQAISDVYQDLMSEGSYHGKGIYDVKVFHNLLCRCFPNEHLLSHDLLEGVHVRVGYASDIVLADLFPQDYYAWTKRQHRWIRGDWQIIDWIFHKVPNCENKRIPNPLSIINRWKIIDNLRRSLIPITCLLILLIAFLFSKHALFWGGFVLLVYFFPTLCILLFNSLVSLSSLIFSWKNSLNQAVRTLVNLSLMPHQAYISVNAIGKTLFRRFVSGKQLLEWESFHASSPRKRHQKFIRKLFIVSLFALLLFSFTAFWNPSAWPVAGFFCLLWFVSPFAVMFLDKPKKIELLEQLSEQEKLFLRTITRHTWRYFDEFVGPQSNWLPPDNYQAALNIEIAQRTSPTNIGLWMLAVLAAYDFKYINPDTVVDHLLESLRTLKKLEMYEGHFLNWYDTQTLKPLHPRFVSTVDSGNLLASFWTLEQGLFQLINDPIISSSIIDGMQDTFNMLNASIRDTSLQKLSQLIAKDTKNVHELMDDIQSALTILQNNQHFEKIDERQHYWLKQLQEQLLDWDTTAKRYLPWMTVLNEITADDLSLIDSRANEWRSKIFAENVSLKMLASTEIPLTLKTFMQTLELRFNEQPKLNLLHKKLQDAIQTAQWLAGEKLALVQEILKDVSLLCEGLNMRFLYNKERKLFAIGYHVDDCRLDTSYYDLLASEARIASFVAIAKDDVPLEHWWALSRPFGYLYGRHVLMSWGGTMFEYLMPLLFKNLYPGSLLTDACRHAVDCQMIYAERRGIPWGISESAFSAIDIHKIYQYRSFGVPGLGFKRNLEDDLVVSPYSTALALAINPKAAIQNFKHLQKKWPDFLNNYGFFESIDFTRQHAPHGERGVIVYAYMAHHQGMTLLALDNILKNNIFRKRFHANPRVVGMESLLCEKAPTYRPIAQGSRKTVPMSRLTPFPTAPIMGIVETPHSPSPKVNLLSNGLYSVMVTNSGGGYSSWKDKNISRWRSDVTADSWGNFCYIKDVATEDFWSATFHPTCRKGKKYSVSFKADRTEFRRLDYQIETSMEIVVSPEDDAEIRLLTLANLSKQQRELELTSYIELVLATHAADAAHPCFNKMFIETESLLPNLPGLLAFRRLKSPEETPIFAGHVVASQELSMEHIEFETDRRLFIGRGRTLHRPSAMDGKLSNSQGYVLDPIFSLRYRLMLSPGQRLQLSFITVVSESKEKTVSLIKKYADLSSSHRAVEMAWAYAQLELRHLRIHQEEVQLFQKLASRILYPHAQLRPSADRLIRNRRGQSNLWAYGISGDLPILVVTVADTHEMDLVRQVLIAHIFWKLRGLKTDLVILNEESAGYEHPLYEQLQRLIQGFSTQTEIGKAGGVYLLNRDQIPEEDIILILSVACANLIAARGSLRQQLVAPLEATTYPGNLIPDLKVREVPSAPLPFVELKFFNEVGGFSPDGREYMIFLGPHSQTPAPWINVIANSQFGSMVSEAGMGATWFGNSQTNRLTPWSNDPVLNPISDIVYIRDDELAIYWTPTPEPIRELDPYRVRHGQGYTRFEHNSHGIVQDLTVFVPIDDKGGLPLRVQRLRLKNSSGRNRKLSVFSYLEWVMGIDREKTQLHLITEWDPESQSLFAFNRYHSDYGSYLAFTTAIPLASSYTCNRTEFLGRNGHASNPAALKRKKLAGLTGAAFDSCGALQVNLELAPNEEKEVIFLLGYAQDEQLARQLIIACREPNWAEQTYQAVISWWDQFLGKIQIETPEAAFNFAFNRWLLYQNLSCRFWGRTAFYQSSGAYGFRDQLQDAMALVYAAPHLAREQILRAASRQFVEGDVQHWWHPPNNGGVRTRISDDLLWLPFATAHYVRVTQDLSILNEEIPFIKGELLREEEQEAYFVPEIAEERASLLEHCRRSLKKGLTEGPHGLPLIGSGDWNDGLNHVGVHGKGESVWLAWFLIHVMNDFADLLAWSTQPGSEEGFRAQAKRLADIVENAAWDGKWYRRAYFDDGTPLGSQENEEGIIDAISQSWAVISRAGQPGKIESALKAVEEYLIKNKEKLVLLLTPAFDKTPLNPGYIKGYPPGVRENGAQYTHGSLWTSLAFAMRGDGDKAAHLLRLMHPISHSSTKEEMLHFRVEPYVLAADIYFAEGKVGLGGWTWYTGSSAWMYRILLENIVGLKIRGDKMILEPVLPKDWENITVHYQYLKTRYEIVIENSLELRPGNRVVELDGKIIEGEEVTLQNDDRVHHVKVKGK